MFFLPPRTKKNRQNVWLCSFQDSLTFSVCSHLTTNKITFHSVFHSWWKLAHGDVPSATKNKKESPRNWICGLYLMSWFYTWKDLIRFVINFFLLFFISHLGSRTYNFVVVFVRHFFQHFFCPKILYLQVVIWCTDSVAKIVSKTYL